MAKNVKVREEEQDQKELAMAGIDLTEDEGAGSDAMDSSDLMIPFLSILQSLSPQLKKQRSEFIPEAEEGMFYNSATHKVYDGETGIVVVPVYYMKRYVEWKTREAGGGLVNDYGSDSSVLDRCTRDEKRRDMTPEGNQIVTSGTYYVLILDEEHGTIEQAVMAFSSTMLKESRRWNSLIKSIQIPNPKTGTMFNPAMFYMAYRIKTVPESNDKGSWMAPKVQFEKPLPEMGQYGARVYQAARDFSKAVKDGAVRSAAPEPAGGASEHFDDDTAF